MRCPGVDGSSLDFAFEYNVGRTWQTRHGSAPSSLMARVLSAIQGAFLGAGDRRCVPLRGKHDEGCVHHWGVVPIKLGILAEAIFGQTGGSQLRQVQNTIYAAARAPITFARYRTGQPPVWVLEPLIAVVEWSTTLADEYLAFGGSVEPDIAIRFTPALHEGLLQGRYQRLPAALVQGLPSTGCDFLIWLTLACQQRTGKLKQGGPPAEFVMTGPGRQIERWRLGLAGASRHELEAAIARAAKRGNALQAEFRLDVVSRPGNGLSPSIIVLVCRPASDLTPDSGNSPATEGSSPAADGGESGNAQTQPQVQKTTKDVREDAERPAAADDDENVSVRGVSEDHGGEVAKATRRGHVRHSHARGRRARRRTANKATSAAFESANARSHRHSAVDANQSTDSPSINGQSRLSAPTWSGVGPVSDTFIPVGQSPVAATASMRQSSTPLSLAAQSVPRPNHRGLTTRPMGLDSATLPTSTAKSQATRRARKAADVVVAVREAAQQAHERVRTKTGGIRPGNLWAFANPRAPVIGDVRSDFGCFTCGGDPAGQFDDGSPRYRCVHSEVSASTPSSHSTLTRPTRRSGDRLRRTPMSDNTGRTCDRSDDTHDGSDEPLANPMITDGLSLLLALRTHSPSELGIAFYWLEDGAKVDRLEYHDSRRCANLLVGLWHGARLVTAAEPPPGVSYLDDRVEKARSMVVLPDIFGEPEYTDPFERRTPNLCPICLVMMPDTLKPAREFVATDCAVCGCDAELHVPSPFSTGCAMSWLDHIGDDTAWLIHCRCNGFVPRSGT
jgi:hypothetical protein